MNTTISSKLKELRKNKNWSQEKVADSLNLSQSTYARIESGLSKSWAIHIMKICDIFETTPEDLFKEDLPNAILNTNQLSEKLIEQYEERIKELKETIYQLKKEKN
jgi:transcriptional regulator with XRE-family HTH domain